MTADLSGLEIGDSIHISAIELPEDVELTITDRDFTIATIAAPTIVEEVEEDSGDVEGEEGIETAEGADGSDAAEGGDEVKE